MIALPQKKLNKFTKERFALVASKIRKIFLFIHAYHIGAIMPIITSMGMQSEDLELFKPKIAVAGVGGAGTNTVHRISTLDIKGADLFAFNTDAKQLNMISPRIKKLVLGQSITHGLGAGGFPEIGAKAAELSRNDADLLLKDINLLFLTAGMGGGTGTGAAPVIADVSKRNGAIVIGIVTVPFSLERVRLEVAKKGVEELKKNVDTLIVIDNQRLVTLYPNLQIEQAFMLADEITAKAVRGITEAITQPSLINLDFADVRTVMNAGGLSMISVGSASGHYEDKVEVVAIFTGVSGSSVVGKDEHPSNGMDIGYL